MSILHCDICSKTINNDTDAEHFDQHKIEFDVQVAFQHLKELEYELEEDLELKEGSRRMFQNDRDTTITQLRAIASLAEDMAQRIKNNY